MKDDTAREHAEGEEMMASIISALGVEPGKLALSGSTPDAEARLALASPLAFH